MPPRSGQKPSVFSPLRGVRSETLSNGLRVYLKEDHRSPVISIHGWVRAGSVDEVSAEAGVAHVLEHMVFKGTRRYAGKEISGWIESLGGSLNAETSKEYTHYYIDLPAEGAAKAVDILSELLQHARFDPQEWERECPVILEEIKRRNDDPDVVLWDLLSEALFTDEALRRPVIGSPDTVAAMTPKTLAGFYRRHYTARQMLLVIVGDFDAAELLPRLEASFRMVPAGGEPSRPALLEPPSVPRHLRAYKPVQQSYLAFGFPTPPSSSPDHEALDLVATILGDGRNARLVEQLRERRRLVWSVSATNWTHEGPGVFGIFAEAEGAKQAAVRPAIEGQMRALLRDLPDAAELARAKNMIQTAWLQGLETFHNQAATIGLYAIEGHLDRLEAYLPRILALTPAELRGVIQKYFGRLALSSAVVEAA